MPLHAPSPLLTPSTSRLLLLLLLLPALLLREPRGSLATRAAASSPGAPAPGGSLADAPCARDDVVVRSWTRVPAAALEGGAWSPQTGCNGLEGGAVVGKTRVSDAKGAPVPGVFVSLSDPETIASELPAVTALFSPTSPHAPSSSPVHIGSLALRETAVCSGGFDGAPANCTLYDAPLAAYEPLFPRARRVWLGLAAEPPKGDALRRPDGGLCESWLDARWVDAFVARNAAAARLISARLGAGGGGEERYGYYLTHELFVEYLAEGCRARNGTWISAGALAPAVADGMGRMVESARAAAPSWPVMWSPAVRDSAPLANATAMSAAARLLFEATALDELNLQDSVGKGSSLAQDGSVQYMTGCEHAADVAEALLAAGEKAPAVAINTELFLRRRANFSAGNYTTVVGDPAEHADRRACYRARGLSVGVSWDALWYYQSYYTEVDWAAAPRSGPGTSDICPKPGTQAREEPLHASQRRTGISAARGHSNVPRLRGWASYR